MPSCPTTCRQTRLAAFVCLLWWSAPSAAPSAAPIDLQHADSDADSIEIDGKVNEPLWQSIPTVGTFSVVEPDTLKPEKYSTRLRVFYTDKGVYVSFDMDQPRDTLVSQLSSRDQRQLNRDMVFITLDSSSDGHYGYWFGIALGDSLMDGTILPERRYASDWDGPWRGATAVTDSGWSAEMFLPWSMMSMPKTEGVRPIGVYASRKVAHLNERWGWPALPETKPQFMSVLDRVQVTNIAPVQQYSLFPYTSATHDYVRSETRYKGGADIFWRPTTNFQTTATLNPDFGTVEADDVIVNLSAIETFFPEKRLFFVEGRDVFIAAPRATAETPTTMLHTRRIGGRAVPPSTPPGTLLLPGEAGQLAELIGAAKITGEIARTLRYGVLAASEYDTEFEGLLIGSPVEFETEGRDFGVARMIYERSDGGWYRGLGYMGTLMSHPDRRAAVHGVDGHYLSTNGRWQWDGQAMYSDIAVRGQPPGPGTGEGGGAYLDGRFSPRKGVNHLIALEYYDEHFNLNDLGFFRRNDLLGTRYTFQRRTSDTRLGRDAFFQVLVPHEWNTEWQVVRTGIFTEGFVTRDDLSEIRFDLNYFPARHEDRNSFGNGTYRITEREQLAVGYTSNSARRFYALGDVRYEGEEQGGHLWSGQLGVVWRPLDRMTTDLTLFHRNRNGWLLHEGGTSKRMITFDAEEWNLRFNLDFFFTARHHFRAGLQWIGIKAFEDQVYQIPGDEGDLLPVDKSPGEFTDDFSISTVNFQLRYRWEIAPMSDLFIVYNKNGNQRALPIRSFADSFKDTFDAPTTEQVVVKVRYRFGS